MSAGNCRLCFADWNQPFQYRCQHCFTTYRPQRIERVDPSNLNEHHRQYRRLRQKVAIIGRKFHNGVKFKDHTFKRHYSAKLRTWCRPRKMYLRTDPYREIPWLVTHRPDYTDIDQSRFGHCWFVVSLSSLATKPDIIDQLIVAADKRAGVYGVTLFIEGNWHYIIIDDRLPCQDKYYRPSTIKVGSKQLWPYLIEKALAKIYGSYMKLEGGAFGIGMTHLTGCAIQSLNRERADMSKTQVFHYMSEHLAKGFLGCVVIDDTVSEEHERNNLFSNHAYQLLAAKDFGKGRFLLKLRNPWGCESWTGKWNEKDKESWSTIPVELRTNVQRGPNHIGIFWMHVEDLLRASSSLEICFVRRDWHENACTGRLYDQEQQNIYAHKLQITKPTTVDIFLWTRDMMIFLERDTWPYFTLVVQKLVENKTCIKACTRWSLLCFNQSLQCDFEIGTYYIYVITDQIKEIDVGSSYIMRSVSNQKVRFTTIRKPADHLAELIMQLAIFKGNLLEKNEEYGDIYVIDHRFTSIDAIVAVNLSPDRYFSVLASTRYSKDEEYISSRGQDVTRDNLPPMTMQVVNTIGTPLHDPFEPRVLTNLYPSDADVEERHVGPLTPQTYAVHHVVSTDRFFRKQIT